MAQDQSTINDPGEVVVETGASPTSAIIWLHGLGADGNDFAPIVPELGVANARFIFPHAPVRPITVNGGMAMRGWFDIDTLDRNMSLDEPGMSESVSRVEGLVQRERERGIADDRIVIAGFSQGGAIALLAGLTMQPSPTGVIALSTFIPVMYQETLAGRFTNRDIPIFMAHGEHDPVVQLPFGQQAAQFLVDNRFTVDWYQYAMPHAVCPPEVQHIGEWLRERLS
jgi:phospholipase/carboxylesterase